MFSPSAAVLINRVDIYRATNATDPDGGYTPTYTPARRSVPCSVQQDSGGEHIDDGTGHRITQVNAYLVMFARDPGVNPRDKLVWRDNGGTTRTLFVESSEDCAGRNAAFTVTATERS